MANPSGRRMHTDSGQGTSGIQRGRSSRAHNRAEYGKGQSTGEKTREAMGVELERLSATRTRAPKRHLATRGLVYRAGEDGLVHEHSAV